MTYVESSGFPQGTGNRWVNDPNLDVAPSSLYYGEEQRRMKLLIDAIPTLGEEPGVLSALARQPVDDARLVDLAAATATTGTLEKWSQHLRNQPDANQRAQWAQLSDAQKESLARIGYQPPDKGGGSWWDKAISTIGKIPAMPFDAAGWFMGAGGDALHLVDVVADQPAHLLRTAFYLADEDGSMAKGGLYDPRELWEVVSAGPKRTWDAWWATGDGDDFVLSYARRDALEQLGGDRDVLNIALEMTSDNRSLEELALRHGAPGTPEYDRAAQQLQALGDSGDFQAAVRTLDWGKVTYGRWFANAAGLEPGSAGWKTMSSTYDFVWNMAADPFLLGGKVAKARKATKFGVFQRGDDVVANMERVYRSDEATRRALDDIAEMFHAGEKERLLTRHPYMARGIDRMEVWQRKYGPINNGERLLEYLKDDAGRISLLSGEWTRTTHHVTMLPRLTAVGSARLATKEWMKRQIRFGPDAGQRKWLSPWEKARLGADEILVPGQDGKLAMVDTDELVEGTIMSNLPRTARFIQHAVTHVPKGSVPLYGPDAPMAIRNLVETTGMLADLPAGARDDWINHILNGASDGSRRKAMFDFLKSTFTSAGMYDDPATKEFADRWLASLDDLGQHFGVDDLDLIDLDGQARRVGVWMVGDRAMEVAVPAFRDIAAQTERLSMTRQMFGWVNRSWVDAFMGGVWKPSVILRLGFIPRAAGEELFALILSRPGAYAAQQLARVAVGGEEDIAASTAADILGRRQSFRMMRQNLEPLPDRVVADIVERSGFLKHSRGALQVVDGPLLIGDWAWNAMKVRGNPGRMGQLFDERPVHAVAYGLADYYSRVARGAARGITEVVAPDMLEAARMAMTNGPFQTAILRGVGNVRHGVLDRTGDIHDDMLVANIGSGGSTRRGDPLTPTVLVPERGVRQMADPRSDPLASFSLHHEMNRVVHNDPVAKELAEAYSRFIDPELSAELSRWQSSRRRILGTDDQGLWHELDLAESAIEPGTMDELLAAGVDTDDAEEAERLGRLVDALLSNQPAAVATAEVSAMARVMSELIGADRPAWRDFLRLMRDGRHRDADELVAFIDRAVTELSRRDLDEVIEATGRAAGLLKVDADTFGHQLEVFFSNLDDLSPRARGFLTNAADRADMDLTSLIFNRTDLRNDAHRRAKKMLGHPEMHRHVQASERSLAANGIPAARPPEKGLARVYVPMIDRRIAEAIAAGDDGAILVANELIRQAPDHLQDHLIEIFARLDVDGVQNLQALMADQLVRFGPNDTLVPMGRVAFDDPHIAKELSEYLAGGIGPGGRVPTPDLDDLAVPIGGQGGYAYVELPEEQLRRRPGIAPEGQPKVEGEGMWHVPLEAVLKHERMGTNLPLTQLEDGSWIVGADYDTILDSIADVEVRRFDQLFARGDDGPVFHEVLGSINIDRQNPLYVDGKVVRMSNPADVADMGDDLPDSVNALVWRAPKDTIWQSFQRFGFERVISPMIDSIARQPRAIIELHDGIREARRIRKSLYDERLWGDEGSVGKVAQRHGYDDSHALVDAWEFELSAAERRAILRGEKLEPDVGHELAARLRQDEAKAIEKALENRRFVEDEILGEAITQRAIARAIPYIDDHAVRSAGNEYIRNLVPFWYAEEQFLKRWARTLAHSPEALRRGQLLYQGLGHAGVLHTDDRGDTVFVIPGTPAINAVMNRVAGSLLGGSVQMPVGAAFTGQIRYAAPGFDRLGVPGFGPIAALPMGMMANRFPELGRSVDTILGERASSGLVESLVPTSVRRFYDALMGDPVSTGAMASAMVQATAILEANGLTPDPDASPQEIEEFHDRVENYARVLLLTKAVVGFIAPAAPQVEFLDSGPLDIGTNLGAFADFDEADMSPEYLEHIKLLGVREGTAEFLRKHPDATAYTVFGTTRPSGAPLSPTEEAGLWMEEHRELLEDFPLGGPWLLPQSDESNKFDRRAYYTQLAHEFRVRRSPEEYYKALKFAAAAPTYFEARDRYIAARVGAENRSDDNARRAIDNQWRAWKQTFFQMNPLFEQQLRSPASQQNRRDTLEELRLVIDSPDVSEADVAHLPLIAQMIDSYDSYRTYVDRASITRAAPARAAVDRATQEFWTWGQLWARQHPQAASLWHGIIEPLLGVDEAELEAQGVLVG